MAATSNIDRTNPIHRGAFFQREILCRTLPALPGDVDIQTALESTADRPTARERFAPLLQDKDCAKCHSLFNPVGLAFEQYDAIGRFRTRENGVRIDATGSISLDEDLVEFADAVELADLVAASNDAENCYGKQWYRAALGRRDVPEDACTLEGLSAAFHESGGDLRALLLALINTDAFRFRHAVEE